MAKLIECTFEALVETWDDPGDYPSNAGQGPLPSYDYLAGIEGEAKFLPTLTELLNLAEANQCGDYSDELQDFLDDFITKHECLPEGIGYVSQWDFTLEDDDNGKPVIIVITPGPNAEYKEV